MVVLKPVMVVSRQVGVLINLKTVVEPMWMQSFIGLGANIVFDPASISLRRFRINAYGYKVLCKKAMAFVNFFSHIPAKVGQVYIMVFVCCQKTALS